MSSVASYIKQSLHLAAWGRGPHDTGRAAPFPQRSSWRESAVRSQRATILDVRRRNTFILEGKLGSEPNTIYTFGFAYFI